MVWYGDGLHTLYISSALQCCILNAGPETNGPSGIPFCWTGQCSSTTYITLNVSLHRVTCSIRSKLEVMQMYPYSHTTPQQGNIHAPINNDTDFL